MYIYRERETWFDTSGEMPPSRSELSCWVLVANSKNTLPPGRLVTVTFDVSTLNLLRV